MSSVTSELFANGVANPYLFSIAVLTGMVTFALFQGRDAMGRRDLKPLFVVLATFLLGRTIIIDDMESLLGTGAQRYFWFTFFNTVGFYFLSRFIVDPNRPGHKLIDRAQSSDNSEAPHETVPTRQLFYFGIFGALAFIVQFQNGSVLDFVAGLANMTLIGVNIRLAAFLIFRAIRLESDQKFKYVAAITCVVVASACYQMTTILSDTATIVIITARILDVSSLSFVLALLTQAYVSMGIRYKAAAEEHREDMEAAKAELLKLSNIATNIYEDSSDLIKKQKGHTLQFMKKVESLERIIQIGISMQRRQRLSDLLQGVVDLVHENLGFKTVTLRLFNKKSQNFETKAHVGLKEEVRDTVLNYRIPYTEYQKMIEPRFRVGQSYFIRDMSTWQGDELSTSKTVRVEDTWGEIDMLIVPLVDDEVEPVGYLSMENPKDSKLSVVDAIDNLESIAGLAVIAIRNAWFFKEMKAKNAKLSDYAEKLASLNKLKSNFVATVSHEFRTPLTSIRAYCDTLIRNADNVDRDLMKQFLGVIDEESGRLMALIDDILDFSHMESGAVKFERAPCDLSSLAKMAIEELRKNFDSKHVSLQTRLPKEPVMLYGEEDMLRQLLINLLHNAAKFSSEGGSVRLVVKNETGSVRILVEDEGTGVPDDQLTKIFEQFHQADSSDARMHGGSGLGLAICKNIADWHDGRIWVENIPNGGARFVVVLPKKEVIVRSHALDVTSTVRRFEIDRFLELMVETVAELLSVRKASIMLLDKSGKELRIESAVGMDEEIVEHARVTLGEGIAGKVAKTGRSMLVTDIEQDDRLTRSNNELLYGSKSFLSVPICHGEEVAGVVNVSSPAGRSTFTDDDRKLLETFVERICVGMMKLKQFADVSSEYESVRETFKAILEAKRYIDVQHDELIMVATERVSENLGLNESTVQAIRYIMNIYDLGLTQVGYHIIKKPGDLTPKDREDIEKHPLIGYKLLSAIETDSRIQEIVLNHHENFDGTGYPSKVKGEAIPVEARIIRVADSLRALVSERPYQRQYTLSEAVEVIQHRAGTFFDPRIVKHFVQVINEIVEEKGQDKNGKSEVTQEEETFEPG